MQLISKLNMINHLGGALPYRRRWQLLVLVTMQLVSGFAEMLGITAFVPLLQIIYDESGSIEIGYISTLTSVFKIAGGNNLAIAAATFGVLFFTANVIKFLTRWAELRFVAAIGNDLTISVFKIIMGKQYIDIIGENSSVWIGRLTNDVNEYVGFLQSVIFLVNGAIISSLVMIAVIMINSTAAFVMAGSIGLVYFVFSLVLRKILLRNGDAIARSFAKRIKVIQESLTSLNNIILGGHSLRFASMLASADRINRIKRANNNILATSPRYALECCGVIVAVCYLIYSSTKVGGETASIVTIGAFALAGTRLLPLTQQIYVSVAGIFSTYIPAMNIVSLLSSPIAELALPKNEKIDLKKQISLSNVCFHYPNTSRKGNTQVLKSLNLKINANEITAIAGSTGGGKTTILNVLIGLLSPQRGTISIDGELLRPRDIRSWQRSIALVPQSVLLVDDTIKRNIAFGLENHSIDEDLVAECIKIVHLEQFVNALPNGIETLVGEMGIEISGGERQRLGIARAIYCKPSVIFMDEATSALDIKTEQILMTKLKESLKELTIVMIAHRPTTIKFADTVIIVAEGRVKKVLGQQELKMNPHLLDL